MTKLEFLERLERELARGGVADAADVVGEYEQHFAFKLADGFSEEEIAARLGDPAELAAQFAGQAAEKRGKGGRAVAVVGLCFSGLFAGLFFVLLAAWGAVLFAFSLACAAAAVCLIGGWNPYLLLPVMPGGAALTIGAALLALSVLAACGCVWFFAFLRQMARAYGRFHRNTMAAAAGGPVLPPLTVCPAFQPRTKRRLRRTALIALSAFAAFFILALAVCAIGARSLEFWHAWGWFGYAA